MPPFAFFKGDFVPLAEAKVGIMTHALNYGTAVFEGIRGNWNQEDRQIYLFRVKEHFERLHKSARILNMTLAYSVDELFRHHPEACRDVRVRGGHLRPAHGLPKRGGAGGPVP